MIKKIKSVYARMIFKLGTKSLRICLSAPEKILIVPVLVFLAIELIVYVSNSSSRGADPDDENRLFYHDIDSNIIHLDESGHLRIDSPYSCHCTNNTFVKLKRNNKSLNYDVYFVNNSHEVNLYQVSQHELDSPNNLPCNLYSAFKRGKHQFVVSYTLYGTQKFYYDKLRDLSRQIAQMYPGWIMRIYHDRSIDKNVICELQCNEHANVDFCDITKLHVNLGDDKNFINASQVHALIWRYFPLSDEFVDVASFRDSDSFILERELDSVNVWLKSDKLAHIMRDHPMHTVAIMGGMWGVKTFMDRPLSKRIVSISMQSRLVDKFNSNRNNRKGLDQEFLEQHVWHLLNGRSIEHDSFGCRGHENAWPTRRQGNCFVGSPSECDKNKSDFYTCPIKCRPRDHPDWSYC